MEFKKREVKRKPTIKRLGPDFGGFKEHVEQQLAAHTNMHTREALGSVTGNPVAKRPNLLNKMLTVSMKVEVFELGEVNKIDITSPIKSSDKSFDQETGVREFVYPINQPDSLKGLIKHWNANEWINNNNKKIKFTLKDKK